MSQLNNYYYQFMNSITVFEHESHVLVLLHHISLENIAVTCDGK